MSIISRWNGRDNLQLSFIMAVMICILPGFMNDLSAQSIVKPLSIQKFKNPESISKPLTWWHWINGNVTKNGIKKDLQDMQRVGIGGVQLFDTHMYLPKGPVRYGSQNWYDHVHYAMQICDSLGLEFYIMNSPGWSGAGGPWINIERSMKQLVYSETDIANDANHLQVTQPYAKLGFYKDVALLAVPAGNDGEKEIRSRVVKITNPESNISLNSLIDNDYTNSVEFEKSIANTTEIVFEFNSEVAINTLNISLGSPNKKNNFEGSIEASVDGSTYIQVAKFNFEDHSAATANFTIPFLTEGIEFLRLNICGTKGLENKLSINEIKLRNLVGIDNWVERTGMSKSSFLPEDLQLKDTKKGIDLDDVIDVSKYFDPLSGKLHWDAPEGRWTILRFGYTTTGRKNHPAVDEGTGYEVDKLDAESVSFQFNQSLGRIIQEAGNLTGKTFKGILFDSYEGGFQNWTGKFSQMFMAKRGYDIKPYLPIMTGRIIGSEFQTSSVMWDFQRTLTTLFSENYYGTMQKLAHDYKLKVFSESQGGPMAPAFANAYTDVPMNEFWTDGIERREKLIKQTVSIANVLGRKIVAAESFTSKPEFGKWQILPEKLKKIGDYAFTTGINRFTFHTYTHQPYDVLPGFTMGRYGTHFGRTNTWWKYAGEWIDYLSRSQYLLQQGRIVADVCYLFPNDAVYEFPPKMPLLAQGYNYDICYPSYLRDMKINKGEMVLPSGATYRLMVLPEYPYMNFETLQRLQGLLQEGAILSGPPPLSPPDLLGYTKNKNEFDLLVKEIWGDLREKSEKSRSYGKGRIYWGKQVSDILKELSVEPDIIFDGGQSDSLRYIHRIDEGLDIYFISNHLNSRQSVNISVRAKGRYPEIWDAVTGKNWDVSIFDTTAARTEIPMVLEPNGSVFIIFNKPLQGKWIKSSSLKNQDKQQGLIPVNISLFEDQILSKDKLALILESNDGTRSTISFEESPLEKIIKGPWKVDFVGDRDTPESIMMKELALLQANDVPGIKYYSGTVAYSNHFSLNSQITSTQTAFIDLGEMYDIAEVFVNGKTAGVIWKKPHRLDISSFLKKGNNELKIMVTNRWINRLIGDETISTDLKYDTQGTIFTKGRLLELPSWLTNLSEKRPGSRTTFSTWKHYSSESPLTNSGLAGPIRVVFYNQLNFKR